MTLVRRSSYVVAQGSMVVVPSLVPTSHYDTKAWGSVLLWIHDKYDMKARVHMKQFVLLERKLRPNSNKFHARPT